MLPGLQRVLATLSARDTRLGDFVRGAAAATTALAPLSDELGPLIAQQRGHARRAGRRRRLARREHRGVPRRRPAATESALRHARPGAGRHRGDLARAAPGGAGPWARPRGSLSATARTAIRVDPKVGAAGPSGGQRAGRGRRVLAQPRQHGPRSSCWASTDLATFGSSAFVGLGAILQTTWDAEKHCRAASTWMQAAGGHLQRRELRRQLAADDPVFELGQMLPQAEPSPNLHANPYPNANAERVRGGQRGLRARPADRQPAGDPGRPVSAPTTRGAVLPLQPYAIALALLAGGRAGHLLRVQPGAAVHRPATASRRCSRAPTGCATARPCASRASTSAPWWRSTRAPATPRW